MCFVSWGGRGGKEKIVFSIRGRGRSSSRKKGFFEGILHLNSFAQQRQSYNDCFFSEESVFYWGRGRSSKGALAL